MSELAAKWARALEGWPPLPEGVAEPGFWVPRHELEILVGEVARLEMAVAQADHLLLCAIAERDELARWLAEARKALGDG